MGREIKVAIKIAIDVILLGILVTIVAVFGTLSRDALNNKTSENNAMVDITEYKDMYAYTRGKTIYKTVMGNSSYSVPYTVSCADICETFRNKGTINCTYVDYLNKVTKYKEDILKSLTPEYPQGLLTGSDIALFLTKFPQVYNVSIQDTTGTVLYSFVRVKDIGEKDWYESIDSTVNLEDWSLKFLTEKLKPEDLNSFYFCYSVYDDVIGEYETVNFVKVAAY